VLEGGAVRRRILLCALAMFFVLGVAPGASAATDGRPVAGTMTGAGGFRLEGCGQVTNIGSGEFCARGLGRGTYAFNVCVFNDTVLTFDGTITLTTAGGATLTGTIGGTFTGGAGPIFDVVITGGTKQFAQAGGTLTFGPLVQSDFTNCYPQADICLDWRDTGPITGTITNVA